MDAAVFWSICVVVMLIKFAKTEQGKAISNGATNAFLKKMGW